MTDEVPNENERRFPTALAAARHLIANVTDSDMRRKLESAIESNRHPQSRTKAFHEFYGAPIHRGPIDRKFLHMDNQRVAFRGAFVLSEAIELIAKGLGVQVELRFHVFDEDGQSQFSSEPCMGDNHLRLATQLEDALDSATEGRRDLIETIDALTDLNVVVNGFGLELGVPMDEADRETAASNFTKMGPDGQPMIGDGVTGPVGKVLKGPNFIEPQFAKAMGHIIEEE